MKTKIIFHLAGLAGLSVILACTSCSKQEEPAKQAQVSKQKGGAKQAQGPFTATRNGAVVNLEWTYDLSVYKSAELYRNATGQARARDRIAKLQPAAKQYKDTLLGAQAYYYWLKVTLPSGPVDNIGPIRAEPDEQGVGKYSDIINQYPWNAFRDNTTATISWDFPEAKYDYIKIIRSISPDPITRNNVGVEVYSTMEWKQNIVDTLPDPDSDYWYRVEIKISDGPFIRQGPIGANFKKPQ
jgi:hypothetical protein